MPALRVQAFDGRDARTGHRPNRRDARTGRSAIHVHGARAAHANPASKFRAGESKFITDYPEEGGGFRALDLHRPIVELKRCHEVIGILASTGNGMGNG
jgi:hypothetical protein